ncbi:MAG: response regulator, partial [Clostridiales bacterium]|nr:response regulator [Clostridiales bacterium]
SMLNWQELGIEICGTAMNGKAAWEMILKHSPQIVITDIKMPIMNGLELAKKCQNELGPLPLFLVLTSYEEFELAREALSCQVVDYLIKLELDETSLKASIQRALKRLDELKASQAYRQENNAWTLTGYGDKFYMRLLHNLFDSREQFEIQVRDLKLDFSDTCYLAAHGEIHSDNASHMELSRQMNLYSSSLQMIQESLVRHAPCHVISLDMVHFAVIYHFPSIEKSDLAAVRESLTSAASIVHNYFNVWLTAGIGCFVNDPLKISASYQDARQAFSLASRSNPLVLYSQISDYSRHNSFNITMFREPLIKAFEEFDTDALDQTLTEIADLFRANSQRTVQAVDAASNILYLAISLLPNGEETIQEIFAAYPDGYRSLYTASGVPDVIQWMNRLKEGLCEELKHKRKTYKDHVVSNVQKYISGHIEDRLSLNEVAAVFGLSPNYLSTLFKKTCNIGFTEYITQKKISRAKALLMERDYKIYEVADRLGFESAFYFSKV